MQTCTLRPPDAATCRDPHKKKHWPPQGRPTKTAGGCGVTSSGSAVCFGDQPPADATVSLLRAATFSVSVASAAAVTYAWQRAPPGSSATDPAAFAPIAGAASSPVYSTPVATFADDGARFRCVATSANGVATSGAATLHVVNAPPPAAAITPGQAATTYRGGDSFTFVGSATDAADGSALPAAQLSWTVQLHHEDHFHPFVARAGVAMLSFTIPAEGEGDIAQSYLITLTATDARGIASTATATLQPVRGALTLMTLPPNLVVTIQGMPFVTPTTYTTVAGMLLTLGPGPAQADAATAAGATWSDGVAGAQRQLTTPNEGDAAALTVTFPSPSPSSSQTPSQTQSPLPSQSPTPSSSPTPSVTQSSSKTATRSPAVLPSPSASSSSSSPRAPTAGAASPTAAASLTSAFAGRISLDSSGAAATGPLVVVALIVIVAAEVLVRRNDE